VRANVYVEGNQVKIVVYSLTPHTRGVITAGSTQLTVADPTGFLNADPFFVENAGPEGGDLVTTIAAPPAGNVLTLAAAAAAGVKAAVVGKRADPTSAVFKVKRPNGTLDTFTNPHAQISNPLIGKWILTYDPPVSGNGTYWWRFEGTGTAKGAVSGSFVMADDEIV